MRRFSFAKFVGRFGTIAVDTFSTLIFFAMQGRSWVLITTGLIFAFVKVWHWQRSFNSPDKLKQKLHRVAWCVMAALSIYFLITLGVAITEPEPEQIAVVDESAAALEKAVAESKAARVNALVQEQTMLLSQNASLTERLSTFGQWSNAAADFRATINGNNERLGKIGDELKALYEQQSEDARRETEAKKEAQKENDNLILASIRNFKPIGAPALLERVMPQRYTGFAIRFLFFLIGVVMEITLALASLPDGEKESAGKEVKSQLNAAAQKIAKEKAALSEKYPPLDEVMAYIDIAIQGDQTLLSDESAVAKLPSKIDNRRCAEYKKFIASFVYKGKPIVDIQDGRYISRFDKENTKRFIELQYSVQRKDKKGYRKMKRDAAMVEKLAAGK